MTPDDTRTPEVGRRTVLRASAAAATTALGAGAAGPAAAQAEGPDWGGWFDDVDNYDGLTDLTGQGEATVEVGAEGNGGPYAFEPPAIRIDPGTTVRFTWVSDAHNVLPEEQPSGAGWRGHEPIEDEGFEFSHTFETEGLYKYFCQPHRSLGMKGGVVVGQVGAGGEESGGGSVLTPELWTLAAVVLLAVLSPVVFGAYLLLRGREPAATDGGPRGGGGSGGGSNGGGADGGPDGDAGSDAPGGGRADLAGGAESTSEAARRPGRQQP